MKHVIRRPVPRGFGPVARRASGPAALVIRHLGSDEKYELPLAWDAGGVAESAWAIPKSAKLGTYEVIMRGPAKGDAGARVHIRAVPGRGVPRAAHEAVLRPPTAPLIAATEFPVDLGVQYLAGGGAPGCPSCCARR